MECDHPHATRLYFFFTPASGRNVGDLPADFYILKGKLNLAPADFYILKGKLKYRMGEAAAGCYAYEPTGAIHETTTVDEETIVTFNSYGPSIFFNADGSVRQILNHETALEMLAGKEQNFCEPKAEAAAA